MRAFTCFSSSASARVRASTVAVQVSSIFPADFATGFFTSFFLGISRFSLGSGIRV